MGVYQPHQFSRKENSMKNITKKLTVALALCLALVLSAVPVLASADVPSSVTVYRTSSSGTSTTSFYIDDDGDGTSFTVKGSTLKSSKTSVLEVTGVGNSSNSYNYYSVSSGSTLSDSSSSYAYINLSLKKKGTSNVSFKIGSKKYTVKVNVKNYTNPVSSLKITGVSSGKNLKSKFKSSASASGKLSANTSSSAKIVLKAADGWKIQNLSIYDSTKGISQSYYSSTPKASVTLRTGKLYKSRSYSVYATLVNTSTKGEIDISYSIN